MGPKTRRQNRNTKVLDVRSPAGVKMFEKLIVNGNLTMVLVKAKWCGACHRFNDEVWSHLTKLKNKSMNLASVDSEMIGQTSLANVPRKFYPTLLLVGKDKKPATFIDEDGSPTNSMPRNASLSEDRETLSNLIQTPKNKLPNANSLPAQPNASVASLIEAANTPQSMNSRSNTASVPESMNSRPNTASAPESMTASDEQYSSPPLSNFVARGRNSVSRNSGKLSNSVGVSPFKNKATPVPSIANQESMMPQAMSEVKASMPPDVGSDLVASQTNSSTGTASVLKTAARGGRLLNAIRNKTASLRAMLKLRSHHTRRNRS
jgi:hypothetical protein